DDGFAVVPLNLNAIVLDRAAAAATVLEPGGQLPQPVLVERQAPDERHPLAPPAFRFPPDADDAVPRRPGGGLARRWWVFGACALCMRFVAPGADAADIQQIDEPLGHESRYLSITGPRVMACRGCPARADVAVVLPP